VKTLSSVPMCPAVSVSREPLVQVRDILHRGRASSEESPSDDAVHVPARAARVRAPRGKP